MPRKACERTNAPHLRPRNSELCTIIGAKRLRPWYRGRIFSARIRLSWYTPRFFSAKTREAQHGRLNLSALQHRAWYSRRCFSAPPGAKWYIRRCFSAHPPADPIQQSAFLGACPQPGAKVLLAAPSDTRTHQTTAQPQRCFRLTPSSLTSTATKIVAKPTAILGVTSSL